MPQVHGSRSIRYFAGMNGANFPSLRCWTWMLLIAALTAQQESIGQTSNALHFDGTNDFVATTCPGVIGTGGRTVEAWVKTTANCVPTEGGLQQVICDWGTFVTGGRFTLNLLWSNSVRIEVGGSGLSGTTPVNDGVWHHVAASYDPSISINQFKLYIDGELEVQGNISTPVSTGSQYNVRIGKRVDDVNHFEGAIDELRVWATVRTPAQIAEHWNKELCATAPGLIGYYRFNQGIAGANNVGENDLDDAFGTADGNLYLFSYVGPTSNWVAGAPLPGGVSTTENLESCGSFVAGNGEVWSESGTYEISYAMDNGCDSTVQVNFTYSPQLGDTTHLETCGSTVEFNGQTLTEPGLHAVELTTADGVCDSLVWADVTFFTSSDTTYSQYALCAGEFALLPDGSMAGAAGEYTIALVNAQGCDSIVVAAVEVTDVAVELASLAGEENVIWHAVDAADELTFAWLDCANDFAPLSGQTQDSLTLQLPGSYALETSLGACADTTACIEVPTIISVTEHSQQGALLAFPNPARAGERISVPTAFHGIPWQLLDAGGRTIAAGTTLARGLEIPADLSSGSYTLRCQDGPDVHQTQLFLLR